MTVHTRIHLRDRLELLLRMNRMIDHRGGRPSVRMMSQLASIAGCLLLAGCGGRGYDVAPVSGAVTVDERPAAGVHVSFQPISQEAANINPGPGSYGVTGEDGRFTLETVEPTEPGAVVGRHRVRFTLSEDLPVINDDVGRPTQPKLADRYIDGSLTFDVPAEGTDKADFDLQSR